MPSKSVCDQTPIKTSGTESLMGSSGQNHGTHVAIFSLLGKSGFCVIPPWEGENI